MAMINGVQAAWRPGDPPSRDWEPIRAMYWGREAGETADRFLLGRYDRLTRFFASSRSSQVLQTPPPTTPTTPYTGPRLVVM
jgi:hypothetical protein